MFDPPEGMRYNNRPSLACIIGPRSLQNENSLVDVQKFVELLGVWGISGI